MNCDRTHISRQIDYSSANLKFEGDEALRAQIVNFVGGIKRPRTSPVSATQIVNWFRGTPAEFVKEQLTRATADGGVQIGPRSLSSARRWNGAYVYWVN